MYSLEYHKPTFLWRVVSTAYLSVQNPAWRLHQEWVHICQSSPEISESVRHWFQLCMKQWYKCYHNNLNHLSWSQTWHFVQEEALAQRWSQGHHSWSWGTGTPQTAGQWSGPQQGSCLTSLQCWRLLLKWCLHPSEERGAVEEGEVVSPPLYTPHFHDQMPPLFSGCPQLLDDVINSSHSIWSWKYHTPTWSMLSGELRYNDNGQVAWWHQMSVITLSCFALHRASY